jgi:alpha-galactosidase
VLDARGAAVPAVIHWGADLGDLTPHELSELAAARERAVGPSAIDEPLRLGLVPLLDNGWSGIPGLDGRHDGRHRRPTLRLDGVGASGNQLTVSLIDDGDGPIVLGVEVDLILEPSGVLRQRLRVTNRADAPFELTSAIATIPVPAVATERLDFTGAWAAERAPQRARILNGTALRESRHGRNGHDDAFVTVAGSRGFGFRFGEVWATHLAWSGDKRTWIDSSATGFTTMGGGELLAPGEVRLGTDETYESPWLLSAWSGDGLDGISERFHAYLRALPAHPSTPRPLTLNTWEAVYFDQSFDALSALVDAAARVGVERFVLDDGWMTGRTDDRRALGDWTVDSTRWPDGLGPLVERVRESGMQFGLWVEPEMVSLDSELAREHPDWILREATERLPLSWRHQQVLDLGREEVREHVRDALFAVLDEYGIGYLKWDMNRDLLGGSAGAHVRATYRLMEELHERYPALEIESCSSGGARIDAGILERTQRVWPSDTNDAHDRQSIMRWTSLLVPFEYLGSHVGPAPAHTSGRSQSLSFLLSTALLGHAGIEWDLTRATESEITALRTWGEVYKQSRELIHSGRLVRGDDEGDPVVTGVIAFDGTEAMYWIACLESAQAAVRQPRRLAGLDPSARYRVSVVDVGAKPEIYWGTSPAWLETGITLSGSVLGSVGIELPHLHPDEALVVRVSREA